MQKENMAKVKRILKFDRLSASVTLKFKLYTCVLRTTWDLIKVNISAIKNSKIPNTWSND